MASAADTDTGTHPQTLLNERRRGKKGEQYSDESIQASFDSWLQNLSQCPPCNDECITDLDDADIRSAVGNYLFHHGNKKQTDRSQTLVEWVRAARANGNNGKNDKYTFPLPCHGEFDGDAKKKIQSHKPICLKALKKLFKLGRDAWLTISKRASNGGVVPPHGNKGKPNGRKRKPTDPVIIKLKAFMTRIERLGEPCATRLVREETGETTVRDDEDNAVYLPMVYGKRSTYKLYCYKQGWSIQTNKSGNYVNKRWIGSGPPQNNIVSYKAFHNYWHDEFPHMKTSSKREDICNDCYIYANRNRVNFAGDLEDDNLSAVSDDSEEYECENAGRFVDDLTGTDEALDDEEINPPVDINTVTFARLQDAARHVRSAKSQRAYLRTREAEAIEDRKNNVPFHLARHSLTFDYCMNVEVPHLGAEQLGMSYYLKKWNGYIFGVVNAAHEFTDADHRGDVGHFMNAFVYEEWEGAKGSDNVASLVMLALKEEGMLRVDENGTPIRGNKLSMFCDNCTGQNKNNTVLRMAAYLVESGYFREVEFVFLIVGHTKNSCDRLFNSLKQDYRNQNIWSFTNLLRVLDKSYKVKVHRINHLNFFKWGKHLDEYYRTLKHKVHTSVIQDNHIFSVTSSLITTNEKGQTCVSMKIREADLPDAIPFEVVIKKPGINNNKAPNSSLPAQLEKPVRNPMKTVVYWEKWKKIIPGKFHAEMCPEPTDEQRSNAKKDHKTKGQTKKGRAAKRRKLDELEAEAMTTPVKVGEEIMNGEDSSDEEDMNLTQLALLKRRLDGDDGSSDEEDINLAELALLKEG